MFFSESQLLLIPQQTAGHDDCLAASGKEGCGLCDSVTQSVVLGPDIPSRLAAYLDSCLNRWNMGW